MRAKKLKKKKLNNSKKKIQLGIMKKKWNNKNKIKSRKQLKGKNKRAQSLIIKQSLYLLTITFFRRNIFLVACNIKGEIKICLSSGQLGYKNKNKIAFVPVSETTKKFLRLVWRLGIRRVIIRYKGYHRIRKAFIKAFRTSQKKNRLNVLAFLTITHNAFNGCRQKKQRRR